MTLPQRRARLLTQSSPVVVQEAFSRLTRRWSRGLWLSRSNRYRVSTTEKVEADKNNARGFIHGQIAEYIAASTVTHCFDGWSLLARALEAELAGDPDTARHLGYYAELRAGMSILAVEGIGIFNRSHVVLLGDGRSDWVPGSTHAVTWEALQIWAGQERSAAVIFRAIQPVGIPLWEWIAGFGGGATFLAADWLAKWGLDLQRLSQDREARNLASYRPTALVSSGPKRIDDTIATATQFWTACRPGPDGGFPSLDRHLLRRSLAALFKSRTSRSPKQAMQRYRAEISTLVNGRTLSEAQRSDLSSFLTYGYDEKDSRLLTDADRDDPPSHLDHSSQVLARATLLLRIATGMVSTLFHNSNVSFRSELIFWWNGNAVRRRLWEATDPPSSFSDLWMDVEDALHETERWVETTGNPDSDHSFWSEQATAAATLTTAERIFLWGVSP